MTEVRLVTFDELGIPNDAVNRFQLPGAEEHKVVLQRPQTQEIYTEITTPLAVFVTAHQPQQPYVLQAVTETVGDYAVAHYYQIEPLHDLRREPSDMIQEPQQLRIDVAPAGVGFDMEVSGVKLFNPEGLVVSGGKLFDVILYNEIVADIRNHE